MKTLLLNLATCALFFTSCSMNEVFENESEANAISFSNLNGKLTKALGANDDLSNYKVYGAWSEATNAWYIDAEVNGTNNGYSPQKYWPGRGDVSFYSYAPSASPYFVVSPSSGTSAISGTYTVGADAQEDFTIATPVLPQKAGTVNLVFNHMLTKITMNVQLEPTLADAYEITQKEGTLTLDYNSATFNVLTGSQETYGASGSYVYLMAANDNPVHAQNGKHLKVMPQPENNSGKIQLAVEIKDKATGLIFIPKTQLYVVDLNTVPGLTKGKLDPGKWYKFTFTIMSTSKDEDDKPLFNSLVFSASNAEWIPQSIGLEQP